MSKDVRKKMSRSDELDRIALAQVENSAKARVRKLSGLASFAFFNFVFIVKAMRDPSVWRIGSAVVLIALSVFTIIWWMRLFRRGERLLLERDSGPSSLNDQI